MDRYNAITYNYNCVYHDLRANMLLAIANDCQRSCRLIEIKLPPTQIN